MPKEKKIPVRLWNTGSVGYLPVFAPSRVTCDENKIFAPDELSWHEIILSEDPVENVRQCYVDAAEAVQQCYEASLKAIEEKERERKSIAPLPVVPKTPKRPKKTLNKVKAGKIRRSSTCRRSTRSKSSMQKMVHNRKSLVLEALQVDEPKTTSDVEINETSREKESLNQASVNSAKNIPTKDTSDHCSFDLQEREQLQMSPNSEDENQENAIAKQQKSTSENKDDSLAFKLFLSGTEDEFEDAKERLSDSITPLVAPKKAPKKKGRPRKSRMSVKRCTRRTRQAVRLSLERKSMTVADDASKNVATSSNEDGVQAVDAATSSPANEATPSVENFPVLIVNDQAPMECVEPISEKRQRDSKLRVSIERLSSSEIHRHLSGNQLSEQPKNGEVCEKRDDNVVASDSAESFEKNENSAETTTKNGNRKRKTRSQRNVLEKKRKTLRESIDVQVVQDNEDVSPPNDSSNNEESSSKCTKKDTVAKPSRPKPRIAKPVIKKKNIAKSTRSSVKQNGRVQKVGSLSTTPVRTRQRFMSPLLRTPTSSNIHTAIKSFLNTNTPEPINKEAIIETKKKLLEEKQRQGEERQRKIEEEKKQKLAEARRKREERALRAIRVRETKEKEKKEQQHHIHDKWEQRIADANRTKTQQKLEKTAKITKQMEKIAKAGAKRKEEEEEKIKRIKEQNEEREKRLLQQQAEKKLVEEQKQKERQEEEQKKLEEEKIKEAMRLAQLEEEKNRKAEEEAALKKKLEQEAKRKKQKEKMEQERKKAEMEREALRKKKQEESRLAKEEEKKRKQEERRARAEKMRMEREKAAAAAREESLRAAREAEREAILQFEKEMAKKLEAARKRKEEERKEQEEAEKRREEHHRKVQEAELRIKKLQASKAESQLRPPPLATKAVLNSTYSRDESVNYDMTPRGPDRLLLPSTATNYNIDDFCSDDSTDDEDRPKKVVPKWAKGSIQEFSSFKFAALYATQIKNECVLGALLYSAILHQYNHPPDLSKIFPSKYLFNPVYLPTLFQRSKERYYKRTSSAFWNSPVMPAGHISFTEQCKGFE